MKSLNSLFVALAVVASAGSPAFGVVVGTGELAFPAGTNNETATFTPPSSIIQGLTPTFTGGNAPVAPGTFGSWATENDGIVGPANLFPQTLILDGNLAGYATPFAVYTLDLSVNTYGYDITSIQSFAGWTGERIWQSVEIKYALVGEAITSDLSHTLGTFTYKPDGLDNANWNASKLTIEDNFGAVMLTGVSAIQINFVTNGYDGGDAGKTNYTAYKEISVVGTASVPEPSTVLLTGVAAAGLLLRFRRK